MTEAKPTHALFDAGSFYAQLRAEFDPKDKVFGYFLSQVFQETVTLEVADESDNLPLAVPFELELPVAPSSPYQHKPQSLAAGVEGDVDVIPGVTIVRLMSSHMRVQNGQVWIRLRCDAPKGQAYRIFLLSPAARRRLLETVDVLEDLNPTQELEAVLADNVIRNNHELARLLAAVPEFNGVVGESGMCEVSCPVPDERPELEPDTWLVAVVDAS